MKTQHRRATPGARLTRTIDGRPVKLVADELGVIEITSEAERRAADAFGLRVTRVPRLDPEDSKKKER